VTRRSRTAAPRLLRFAALSLDAMLAFLVAVALRVFAGIGATLDGGAAATLAALFDFQLLALTLLLIWGRDVVLGHSAAKWLLCLTVTDLQGRPLSWRQRLLRALVGVVPLASFKPGFETRVFGWRVVSYSPSRPGLVMRTALTAGAAVFSVTWAFETVRPSIGRNDARQLADVLMDDPLLPRTLGEPLGYQIGDVTRRAQQPGASTRASFRLRIVGPQARQDMLVHARKVDGIWTLEELTDIEVTTAEVDTPDVARR
jgi:uncharacterized RDD family membrane protein YckC